MRLLFLDFDGVLHGIDAPALGEKAVLFKYAGDLAVALEPFVDVSVVISSSWAREHPLPDLIARLGPLAVRVIDTTEAAYRQGQARYRECEAIARNLNVNDWRMLDDQVDIVFGDESAGREELRRVIFCDPVLGLSSFGVMDRLQLWLEGGS